VKRKAFFRELWPIWFGLAVHLSLLVNFSKVWCTMRAKLWMKLERGRWKHQDGCQTVQRWFPLKDLEEKIWRILYQSHCLIVFIHIDQQKVPGVARKERRVWCKGKHWPIFAIGCRLCRSKLKLEELKVGLKFSFWKVRISILLGEMLLPVDSLKILKT
jgi:hypothetical protein